MGKKITSGVTFQFIFKILLVKLPSKERYGKFYYSLNLKTAFACSAEGF